MRILSSTTILSRFRPLQSYFVRHPVLGTWIAWGVLGAGAFILLLFRGSTSFNLRPFKNSLAGKNGVFLDGHVFEVNINDKTVSISWVIGGCGSYAANATNDEVFGGGCKMVNRPIDVYFNGGEAQNGSTWSYDPSFHPYGTKDGQMYYVQALNEFQTSQYLDIDSTIYLGQSWTQGHKYPFDRYVWSTSVVLHNPTNLSEQIPIIAITPTDLANNFIPTVRIDIPITQSIVTKNGSTLSLQGRYVQARYDRNQSTKGLVLTIFLLNWGLTFVVFHITVLSLVSRDVKLSEGILILPVTVILTIPALRALFPDSPPFGGVMDNTGLFLQMIIVSVCSIVLLVNISQHQSRATLTRSEQESSRDNDGEAARSSGLVIPSLTIHDTPNEGPGQRSLQPIYLTPASEPTEKHS